MRKRAIAAALLLLMLSGCGVPAPTPSPTANTTATPSATASPAPVATPTPAPTPTPIPPLISDESHVDILAAAAYRPLAVRLYQRATGASSVEADAVISLNDTESVERSMFFGSESLCIAAQLPGDDGPYNMLYSNKDAKTPEVSLEGMTIALDALVFLVSESNAVDSVSEEQLKGILLGEITNWKDVGGADVPIKPYAPTHSGWTMSSLLSVVGLDANSIPDSGIFGGGDSGTGPLIDFAEAGALAATSHAYATMQYRQTGFKMLAINGVSPSAETVASRDYEYTANVCAVINTNSHAVSIARTIYEYLETEESRELIAESGYISVN